MWRSLPFQVSTGGFLLVTHYATKGTLCGGKCSQGSVASACVLSNRTTVDTDWDYSSHVLRDDCVSNLICVISAFLPADISVERKNACSCFCVTSQDRRHPLGKRTLCAGIVLY